MRKLKRIPIKNHQREIQLIMRRSMIALLILITLVFALVLRLAHLQIYKHDMYTTLATNNWLDLVPVEPTRGLIYDRNGIMLADNVPVFSLDITPYDIKDMSKTIEDIKKIVSLSDEDIAQFQKQLRQHRRFDEIPLKLRLTEEEVGRFAEYQYEFPGVMIKARLIRRYPFGASFSHIIGYVGRINVKELREIDQSNYSASHYIGKTGIEKYYEDELHGNVGYEQVENDASGKPLRTLSEIKSTSGKNIYLTIDSNLQLAAEKAMEGNRGAIVAIEPDTGQVLAMASEPGFDPNLFVTGISHQDYEELSQSQDRPLFDRALRGLYPIASTIKPFLALQGLETGVITPEFSMYDQGWFEVSNGAHTYHDWAPYGHGHVNVDKALAQSCDTFFYYLGSKLGIRRIDDILNQFGFGSLTGIDLDDEVAGTIPSPEWKMRAKGVRWYEGDTILSAIGQGYMQATPLQLASATATLATHGKRYMPYVLLAEQAPGKEYIPQPVIHLDNIAASDNSWNTVIEAMEDVIKEGTAQRYGTSHHYTIAAKTGTAQIVAKRTNPNEADKQEDLPERLRDNHLFIAYAPVEHPQIAIAIVTENSNNVIEVARTMFNYYLGKQENAHRESQTETQKAST